MLIPLLLTLLQAPPPVSGVATERAVLRSIEVREGTGAPARPGQEYTVHYTGWLRDGTKFDSSVDRQTPLKFIQGRRQVIAGWDSGFEGMRVGGQRRLLIPYPLAYGEAGRGPIPPKAELTFDVELLAVRDVPPEVAARGLLVALAEYETKLLALARAIPEDKYSYRPTPQLRTISELLQHAAHETRLLGDPGDPSSAQLTKPQVITLLEESFAAARKKLEPLRPAQLAQERDNNSTAAGVYTQTITHAAEHLGQLLTYARILGIAP